MAGPGRPKTAAERKTKKGISMKTSLVAAAAAMAAACAAAPAFAQVAYTPNGFIGFDYTYDHTNYGGHPGGFDSNSYGVQGSTNVGLTPLLNLEVDADYTHVDHSSGIGSSDHGGGYTHLFARDSQGAVGVFGGVHRDWDVTTYTLGLEGAKFYNKFTLSGDVRSDWNDSTFGGYNGGEANLGGHYYLTDNLRLDGFTGYDRVQLWDHVSSGWHVGAGGEYQLKRTPVSFYAAVAYGEDPSLGTANDTAVHVGVRWNFGGGTLKTRERSGATFASTGENDLLRVSDQDFHR
jgi:hypothetical protein